jgi:uncharacterized sodium:solute symporter family permease YidK
MILVSFLKILWKMPNLRDDYLSSIDHITPVYPSYFFMVCISKFNKKLNSALSLFSKTIYFSTEKRKKIKAHFQWGT